MDMDRTLFSGITEIHIDAWNSVTIKRLAAGLAATSKATGAIVVANYRGHKLRVTPKMSAASIVEQWEQKQRHPHEQTPQSLIPYSVD